MPSISYYIRKCERLSGQLNEANRLLRVAQNEALAARANAERIGAAASKHATLIHIARDGRKIRFTFMRNNKLTHIETYGTWDVDLTPLTE